MDLEALFDRAENKANEYGAALALAINTKAQLSDALELGGAAEGNAVYVMATANSGVIPGKNEMERKQAIQRAVMTDPACISARRAAKSAEIAHLLMDARTKAIYQQLQVLLAGLNNLSATDFGVLDQPEPAE